MFMSNLTDAQVIDELSASFCRIIVKSRMSRDELALFLKGFRKTQRNTKPSIYRELNKRFLALVKIEESWRKRRDEDAILMQAWNGSGHVQN